jgi:hypothetical protein
MATGIAFLYIYLENGDIDFWIGETFLPSSRIDLPSILNNKFIEKINHMMACDNIAVRTNNKARSADHSILV